MLLVEDIEYEVEAVKIYHLYYQFIWQFSNNIICMMLGVREGNI